MTMNGFSDTRALHQWSIADLEGFWTSFWDFSEIIAETRGDIAIENKNEIEKTKFFPNARLNYAENLLRNHGPQTAIVFWGEDKIKRKLSFDELREQVAMVASALRAEGVGVGDRIAGFVPNTPEAIIAMLATSSIGAIWSSCSPDFGVQGVLDRFEQIQPKVLFSANGYFYGGKTFNCMEKLEAIIPALSSLQKVVMFDYVPNYHVSNKLVQQWDEFTKEHRKASLQFESLPFNHPLFIMFSSGTTGKPKCIVHGAGGTLLQHMKEHQLHTDIRPKDKVFYFTTCGWMMWNWLVSSLASNATLLLYDGSPFYPSGNILFDYADAESMTVFGTAAKYIDALNKAGLKPIRSHNLASVRTMTSTGSPLVAESFDYVYDSVKKDICLSSISGGTDIISCFALGNPIGPVYRGELQMRGLGLAVEVFNDSGESVIQEKGELVCTKPFPSMPLGFWNDQDGARYHKAYFSKYRNVWHHGDFVELTNTEGIIIYGRSDAILNPGGVRIGTAEIYRQVEQIEEVLESIAVGQEWDGDVRVILFVKLKEHYQLTDDLINKIKAKIRNNASPRHVPAKIIQVADIPRTISGKIVELAVREVIHGRPVNNVEALANPEALNHYMNISELKTA